jgi:2-oxoglutarate ferredoxin oxidoreductase subunit gamma
MTKVEVRICGLGGQGVVLAGRILGRAAVVDGKNVVQTQSYGAEARGSAAKSEVIISDERIGFPLVRKCDVLVAMSQEAYNLNIGDLKMDGVVLVDREFVKSVDVKVKTHSLPATQLAENELKSKIFANVLMLGALARITRIVSEDAMKKAIISTVKAETKDVNIKAFEMGLTLGS